MPLTSEPAGAARDDRGIDTLLTVAGWTGGGVVSGLVFQVLQSPVTEGPFPTARPTDAFFAVVAGSFLVGPVVVALLLGKWRQRRIVGTVAGLCLAGLAVVIPLIAFVAGTIESSTPMAGILGFVGVWGLALPIGVRTLVVNAGRGGSVVDRLWLAAGGSPLGGDGSPATTPAGWTNPGIPVAGGGSWASSLAAAPTGEAPADRPGPPIDPSLPPVVLPPEVCSPRP